MVAIHKYAAIGQLFSQTKNMPDDYYIDSFLSLLNDWTIQMKIPSLFQCGVSQPDYTKIIDASDNKNNPVPLNHDEMIEVLERASNRVQN